MKDNINDVMDRLEGICDAYKSDHYAQETETADLKALLSYTKQCREALSSGHAWVCRWGAHVGSCRGGGVCTCGLTAIREELSQALSTQPGERE